MKGRVYPTPEEVRQHFATKEVQSLTSFSRSLINFSRDSSNPESIYLIAGEKLDRVRLLCQDPTTLLQIARMYFEIGQPWTAEDVVKNVLHLDPANQQGLELQEEIASFLN